MTDKDAHLDQAQKDGVLAILPRPTSVVPRAQWKGNHQGKEVQA